MRRFGFITGRLSAKLTASFLLLSIIPLAVTAAVVFSIARQTIENDTVSHLKSISALREAHLGRWIEDNKRSLRELARRPLIRIYAAELATSAATDAAYKTARDRLAEEHFRLTLEEKRGVLELFLLRATDGQIVVSSAPEHEGMYRENEPYFIFGKHASYVQSAYYSMILEAAAMTISTPVMSANGKTVAVLASRVDLREMTEIMTQGAGQSLSEETYLVNRFNFFVTESRFEPGYAMQRAIHTQGVQSALRREKGVGLYADYRGIPVIGVYRWVPDLDLAMLTEIDQAEAFAPVYELGRGVLIVALLVAGAVALFAIVFSRTITGPVRALATATEEIGRGNLDYRTSISTGDEIGRLSQAFNRMAGNLKTVTASRDELNREIADRKRARQELEDSEERYRAVVEDQTELVMRFLPDGTLTFANKSLSDLMGWSNESMADRPFAVFFDSETRLQFSESLKAITPQSPIMVTERRVTLPDDSVRWQQWVSRGIFDQDGKIAEYQGVGRDITDLKLVQSQLEQARDDANAANRAKSAFLANMSHELRTPLNSVLGFAQVLEMDRQSLSEQHIEYIRNIRAGGEHLLAVVNDILDLSKIEVGKIELEVKSFSLRDLLHQSTASTATMASRKGIEVEVHIDSSLDFMEGDELRIRQVFYNLLSNAIKFTEKGGRVGVEAREEKDSVQIVVWDEGVGIPPEDLERVFVPFEQAGGTMIGKPEGTGLGLAISRKLVEAHGGTLTVCSKPGEGSRFTVRLPGAEKNAGDGSAAR